MEPERPIEAPLKNENSKNKQNIFKITTIVAAAIAACGISFGVYGIIQSSQKDTQISDLKSQNSQKDAQISELENKISKLSQTTEDIAINWDDGDFISPLTSYSVNLNPGTGNFTYTRSPSCGGAAQEYECSSPTTYTGTIPSNLLDQAISVYGQLDFETRNHSMYSAISDFLNAFAYLSYPTELIRKGCNLTSTNDDNPYCDDYDIFKAYDTNYDGNITYLEYANYLLFEGIPNLLKETSE